MKLSIQRIKRNKRLLAKKSLEIDFIKILMNMLEKSMRFAGVSLMTLCLVYISSSNAFAAKSYEEESIYEYFTGFPQHKDYLYEWDFGRLDPGLSWTQLAEQSRSQRSGQSGNAPVIQMAGYMDTNVSYSRGGEFWMLAWVDDPDDDIETVEIYFQGQPTGVFLEDDGISGDFDKGDGLYGIKISIPEKKVCPTTIVLELKATDKTGNTSDLWPYLTIAR